MTYKTFKELFDALAEFHDSGMGDHLSVGEFDLEESGELKQDRVDETAEDEDDNFLDDTTQDNKDYFKTNEAGLRTLAEEATLLADRIKAALPEKSSTSAG